MEKTMTHFIKYTKVDKQGRKYDIYLNIHQISEIYDKWDQTLIVMTNNEEHLINTTATCLMNEIGKGGSILAINKETNL